MTSHVFTILSDAHLSRDNMKYSNKRSGVNVN